MLKQSNSPLQCTIIPIDILVAEILPRLTPTSLLRFKCVNKYFHRLISSKEFINDHLCQSLSSDTNRLLIFCTAHCFGVQGLYSLDLDTPNSSACYIPLPEPFCGYSNYFDIVGSCNGLICLRSLSSYPKVDFMILNPSTGRVKHDVLSAWLCGRTTYTQFGFGYDRLSDDYKLVVVHYLREYSHSSVRVCSMKTNSWRDVKPISQVRFNSSCRRILSPNGVLTDSNLLHWVKLSSDENTFVIGCFDLESETWVDDVPFPDFGDIVGTTECVNLGVFDGCLCMFTRKGLSHTDLWVMKEYGVKESWVKLFVASPSHEYTPLFAYGKKELLLTKIWPHKFGFETCVWYNCKDQTTRMLEFSGASSVGHNLGNMWWNAGYTHVMNQDSSTHLSNATNPPTTLIPTKINQIRTL